MRTDNLTWKLSLFILFIACIYIYVPGLNGTFLLDDFPQLSPLIESVDDGGDVWGYLFSRSGYLGRPVSMSTFIMNSLLYGGDTWYWKAWNLIIHMLTGLAIFIFTAQIYRIIYNKKMLYPAILLTGLWLLHPLHVSTVLYTVQRMAQLSALFILLGLIFYIIGRLRLISNLQRGWLYIGTAFLLWFPLAVFSKENGILFPVLVFVLEYFLFKFNAAPDQKKHLKILFLCFLWLPLLLGVAYVLFNYDKWFFSSYLSRNFTFTERLLTEFRVLLLYINQIIFPVPVNLGFFHDDIAISKSLVNPLSTLFSFLTIVFLLAYGFIIRFKRPIVAFGIYFFFASHLLESTIFSLELMFEHRNYLASFGVLLILSHYLYLVFSTKTDFIKFTPVLFIVIAGTILSFRVLAWSSEYSMYLYMYKHRPDSKRLASTVANIYVENGFYDRARTLLDKHSGAGFRIQSLYIDCQQKGSLSKGDFNQVLFLNHDIVGLYTAEAIIKLANIGLDKKCQFNSDALIQLIVDALASRMPDRLSRQKLFMYKAHYLHKEKRLDDAIHALDDSFHEYNLNPVPLLLASEWLIDSSQYALAKKYYQQAHEITLNSRRDYSVLIEQVKNRLNVTDNAK